ncbi:MAG TPA: HEPN domain-containing protein [Patescibacteria group bacterium]|nr:HEPN domain-containing protein [Patescibacteria group bacterium]
MSAPDRRRSLVRRWLSKARTDLTLASVILERGPDMDPRVCCFHAQQAAEKALKAVLVAQGVEPPFIHNLVAFQALMPPDLDLGTPVAELADLSAAARGTRYVTDADGSEDPTWNEAERAVATAGRVLAAVRAYLGEPG